MNARPALLLALLATWLSPWLPGAAAQHRAGLEEAIGAFVRASAGGDLAERQASLRALVATGHEGAVAPLVDEFAQVSTRLRGAREDVARRRGELGRRRAVLADLLLRHERDPSLARTVRAERERIAELEVELERRSELLGGLEPWYAALCAESPALFENLAPPARRKAEGSLSKSALDATSLETRLASVELLGWVGAPGTAVEMARLIQSTAVERAQMRRRLARELTALKGLEARMQKEQEQFGGRMTRAMVEQYERGRREAAQLQRALTLTGYVLDAAAEAGGRALARESGRDFDRSLASLLRTQRGAKDGARLLLLEMLGHASSEGVRAALRELLSSEKDGAVRATLIDVLARGGDLELVPEVLERWLADPSWHVRSRAAYALALLRVREAIPALIERLAVEQGRVRSDVGAALSSLTGRDFHGNVELWRIWWEHNSETFDVPDLEVIEHQPADPSQEGAGTSFFGIRTESERVLFVLDLSGSMNWSLVPRNNPTDDAGRDPDLPRDGEPSRLEVAQRELIRAVRTIPEGGLFNLVFYASDVWTWQDRLVPMRSDTRSAALTHVEGLQALGGTNIYGALDLALDLAGVQSGDTWSAPAIDTIYMLSDGRASVGVTTDPDEILAHVRDRNRNAGIVIHSVGISGAQDAYLLRSLAEQNGGQYVAR